MVQTGASVVGKLWITGDKFARSFYPQFLHLCCQSSQQVIVVFVDTQITVT